MAKIRLRGVRMKGRRSRSDFALGIVVTDSGVFFDKITLNEDGSELNRNVLIQSTHKGARLLAHWLLEHVPE